MAVTWKKLAFADDVIAKTEFTAKGVLLGGTGAGAAGALAVGSNGQILSADSNETTGLKWVDAPAGGGDFLANGTVPMTGDLDFAGHAAKDVKLHTVADETAQTGLTPVVGKIIFRQDLLAPMICTSAA